MRIIQRYEEFDAEVANDTIGHHFDEKIVAVDIKGLGEGIGIMSSISRGILTFESGATQKVIVKCVARTENIELSKGLNLYSNEINFYNYLSKDCPIEIPACLYAAVDPVTQDILLVLEDLGEEEAGDQIAGCSEAQMRVAYRRAAQLHAKFWGKTGDYDWLNHQLDMKTMLFRRDNLLRPGIEPAIELFPDHFSGNRAEMARSIGENYIDLFLNAMSGEQTIIHGDFRVDNLFMAERDGQPDIITFDWQNTTGANGLHDVAYFSGGNCDDELRGDIEMSVLREYHETLLDLGVRNYSFDECLNHYRYNLLITMISPIAVSGTLDQGNERGKALGSIWLERGFSALENMQCDELLVK